MGNLWKSVATRKSNYAAGYETNTQRVAHLSAAFRKYDAINLTIETDKPVANEKNIVSTLLLRRQHRIEFRRGKGHITKVAA